MAKLSDDKEKNILKDIHDAIYYWYSYFSKNIEIMREHKCFAFVSQWTDWEIAELTRLQKPIMECNKVYDHIKRIVGEQRQNTAQIIIQPESYESGQEISEILTKIIKSKLIENNSDVHYQTAFENALVGGFGVLGVTTKYKNANSFEVDFELIDIPNAERSFFDASAKDPTKCDGDHCGMYTIMTKKLFEAKYPDIPYPQSFPSQWTMVNIFDWGNAEQISVVDFFKKEYFTKEKYLLANGIDRVVDTKELHAMEKAFEDYIENGALSDDVMPEYPVVLKSMRVTDYKIMHYRAIQGKIISAEVFPGKELPLVFVDGDSHIINDRQLTRPYISAAKDPQRFLNYLFVDTAYKIKNARGERFMGTPNNVKGVEEIWKNPENQQGILLAQPDPQTGMPTALPPAELPQSHLAHFQRAEMDIGASLGMHDASQGMIRNVESGVAVDQVIRQQNATNFVYVDNRNRGIKQLGKVILSMIPKLYDSERFIMMQNKDGKFEPLIVNQLLPDGTIKNDLTKGDYKVTLEVGPSFGQQKAYALAEFSKAMAADPAVFKLIGDLWAENLDVQNAGEVARRLKTIVPPDVLAKADGKEPHPPQPNPQMLMMEKQMQLEQETLKFKQQEAAATAALKQQENQLQILKMQVEQDKMISQNMVTNTKAQAEIRKAELDSKVNVVNAVHNLAKLTRNG